MSTLNLNGNYAKQMLSMYLWGQLTPPSPSEIADDKWIRPENSTTTVNIDAQSYMATAGSHFSVANQKIFQLFFNNKHRESKKLDLSEISKHGVQSGNEIILNHEQFVEAFYGNHKASAEAKDAQLNLYHYSSKTDSTDYWRHSHHNLLWLSNLSAMIA